MPEGYKIYQTSNFIKKIEADELDIEKFKKLIGELAAAATVYQNHNMLIDIRTIIPHKSFADILEIISESTKHLHAFHNRIAVIIANEPDRIARAKFFKAGLKPGNFQFEYFTDYEKAIDWLSDIREFSEHSSLATD